LAVRVLSSILPYDHWIMPEQFGTKSNPWQLKTPPHTSDYSMYVDERLGEKVIVCVVGPTTLFYAFRAIQDLTAMLKEHGDWIELSSADEQKPAKDGTVEAWARSESNPNGGWYGLKKGLRGRFGMYKSARSLPGETSYRHDAIYSFR
jgi:hypothetical protein